MALIFFCPLFLFRIAVRRAWIGTALFVSSVALFCVVETLRIETWTAATGIFMFLVYVGVYLPLALRFGVFTVAVAVVYAVSAYASTALLTTQFTSWYGQSSFIAMVAFSALALWAFRVSLGLAVLPRAHPFMV